jgi:holin-like protein
VLGGFVIIMAFLFAGELLSGAGLPLPGNVIGMVLLAVALRAGIVKREWIRAAAEFLVENLSLLFVPAGVGVMAYFNIVERSWLPVSISLVVSTLLVLAFTGLLEDRLRRLFGRFRREDTE